MSVPYIKNRVIEISSSSLSIWNKVISLVYAPYWSSYNSTLVVLQNSRHPSDVLIHFRCSKPPAPLWVFNWLLITANWLCYQNTVARDTGESPNSFTNISYIFTAVNPTLQQNLIAAHCSKFFSMVIYKKSTEHTILQNALILPHIDGLTSNLVCRWRRV